jgi:hypothetical protein
MDLQTTPPNNLTGIKKMFHHPAWALIAAFATYFCMYGYRKPYTAATYSGVHFFGIEYKFLLVISQTLGYVTAKWIGIKFVSEIKPEHRIKALIFLLSGAELMLLIFGFIGRPWNILCLLLNGLSLGAVFGLILGFLEGRRNTEFLIGGLCASFIVSDGVSKTVGQWLLNLSVSENWMPFFAGLVFAIPSLLFIYMLSKVPVPTPADIAKRSVREPMSSRTRKEFFLKYAPGLIGITLVYLFITLLRSVRADFAPELWRDLGYPNTPALFTRSELFVSFGILMINGMFIFLSDHYKAFKISLLTCIAGFVILLLSVLGLHHPLDAFTFMVTAGLGIYIPYVCIHTTIFERLIAGTKERANVGFLMYVVDSVGYTGYIILMLVKYFVPPGILISVLFLHLCIYLGIAGVLVLFYCRKYFSTKLKSS